MWLAARAVGLTRQSAPRKPVLVDGAAGGLGTLALQTLSNWGAKATAVAKAADLPSYLAAGAAEAVDREQNPFLMLRGRFDATLNFAAWDDERALLKCLREGALGHATTVHPLLRNFDENGWVGGGWRTMRDKREMRASLPKGTRRYAWVLFRPEAEALSETARLVELGRLSLPIGIRAPLRNARDAFEHMRRRLPRRVARPRTATKADCLRRLSARQSRREFASASRRRERALHRVEGRGRCRNSAQVGHGLRLSGWVHGLNDERDCPFGGQGRPVEFGRLIDKLAKALSK
jgi:hypothetical protein